MTGPNPYDGLIERSQKLLEGITPGRWFVEVEAEPEEDEQPEVYVCHEQTACDVTVVATMGRANSTPRERKQADAALIAASPALIAEQVEALSRLTRDVEECRELLRDHPPYEADTSFATIWKWLARKDATLTRLSRPTELGADPAFVASQSSPSVSTKGFNQGEKKDTK